MVLVDLESNPLTRRGPILEWLAHQVTDADIVLGDFNTPIDSVHFGRLQEKFVNLAEEGCLSFEWANR